MAGTETGRVIPVTDIPDFESVAIDLNDLLQRPDNADLSQDFTGVHTSYTGDIWKVKQKLEAIPLTCTPGVKEQFIIFAGPQAVGMSIVTTITTVPAEVDPTWPNVSGFICNPYRGRGLGLLSIERRMQAVRQNFGNHAWTFVRKGNVPSEKLVARVGFRETGILVLGHEHQELYFYDE